VTIVRLSVEYIWESGTVRDINISKSGHNTITVVQKNGIRFKTLGKSVIVLDKEKTTNH